MSDRVMFSISAALMPPEQLLPLAKAADEIGYGAISLPDSVFFVKETSADYPYSADGARFWEADTPFIDPIVAIAAMGAVTRNIRFYTAVYKLPLRNPLLVAKEVSSLAVITQNRLSFGIGLAWMPEEFVYTGTQKTTRGARADEAIDIVRAVCAGDGPQWVEYHGDHYDFEPVMISPAPDAPVPILAGGHSSAALDRATAKCDGWISAQSTLSELTESAKEVRNRLERLGRQDDPFQFAALCTEAFDRDSFQRVADITGVTEIQVLPWYLYPGDPNDIGHRLESLERFRDDVIVKIE